ncbi:hypothetical protein M9435_003156 [Picochlorum sp. BPE23]|nr:hypothetical protein M9435_003156 [Picochlorum sp. BPE23]
MSLDIPSDVVQELEACKKSLETCKRVLSDVYDGHASLRESQRDVEPLEAGKQCQELAEFTLSLCQVLLRCRGVNPDSLSFFHKERKRLEAYHNKISKAEARVKKRMLTLDVDAANRFIAAAQGRPSTSTKSVSTAQQKQKKKKTRGNALGAKGSRERDPALSFLEDLSIQRIDTESVPERMN